MTPTSKTTLRSWIPRIVIAALLAVPASGFYILVRPAMPYYQLNRLAVGMTKDEVRNVLGEPREIRDDSVWEYSRWGNQGWVDVHFDDTDRFVDFNDESAIPFHFP